MPKLITIQGPTRGREFELAEEAILGRSPHCKVYIGDLTVSREHARLRKTAEGWVIEDLGSGNGTYVNERRVTRTLLRKGDEIRISNCILRFMTVREEEQKPRWVNMVTVLAGNEPGLVHTVTEAQLPTPRLHQDASRPSLQEDLARSHRVLETLYAVSNAVASVLEPKQLFEHILDYLFKTFPNADRGYVMTLEENQQLVPAAIRLRHGEDQAGGLVVSQTVVGDVLQQGKAVLSTASPLAAGGAKMCAPLAAQGKVLGILLIESSPGGRAFKPEDLDLLTGIGAQAGVAFMGARLHQQLLRQQRLEQDMQFAREIQRSFLPAELPSAPGFRFERRYDPLFEVGGDFYDFIPLPDEQMGILIGDVSGKGVSAALLMARLASDMRYFAMAERSPARVLHRANLALCASARDNMFATVLYLVLDLRRRGLTLSNAGHNPPLLRRAGTGEVTAIDDATNLALGVLPEAVFDDFSLELGPGDGVLLCTDGVVEAKSPAQEEYGFARLQRALASAPPEALLELVLKDLQRHTAGSPQYDDITLVAFSRLS